MMNYPRLTILRVLGRRLTAFLLVAGSAAAAYATLGDGRKKSSSTPKNALLSARTATSSGFFSLKSGYSYKGSEVLSSSTDKKYFSLNTVVNVQKGNTNYVLPLKKKVIIDKVKIDIGNRQFRNH
ncbi:MAG: hypothetical protein ACO25B_04415 [Chitinophagaceae bacterium]